MYSRVVGVDPSLSSSGICVIEFDEKKLEVTDLRTLKTKPSKHMYARIARYESIAIEISQTAQRAKKEETLTVIEAYSFMAFGSAVTQLPELGCLIRHMLECNTVPWFEVPPSTAKKFGTGSGKAMKDLVMMATYQKWGHHLVGSGFELQDSNQADAYVLALMGVEYVRWKQFGVAPSKEHLKDTWKKMDEERFYQLKFGSLV